MPAKKEMTAKTKPNNGISGLSTLNASKIARLSYNCNKEKRGNWAGDVAMPVVIKVIRINKFNSCVQKARRKGKLINGAVQTRAAVGRQMSFKLGLDRVQEVLVLALMLVFVFAVFYSNIELTYKIGIGVLVFSIIFLTGLASQAAKQEAEKRRF